jgi:hypothetical protein
MAFAVISSLRLAHNLSNVHTWAIFFLRHLANTVRPAWSPFEHQLTPALSPIWGPSPTPRRPEEVVYIVFPPKLPQQHKCTIYSIGLPSFILIIHHIQTIFTSSYYATIILSFLRLLLAG